MCWEILWLHTPKRGLNTTQLDFSSEHTPDSRFGNKTRHSGLFQRTRILRPSMTTQDREFLSSKSLGWQTRTNVGINAQFAHIPSKHNRPTSAELPTKEGQLGSPDVAGKFPSHNFLVVYCTSARPRFEFQATLFLLDRHAGHGAANGPRCESKTKKSHHSVVTLPIIAN